MGKSKRARGMTLVELLVVASIIGMLVAVAGLSIGLAGNRDARDEAIRLAGTLESVALVARSTGRRLAWSHDGSAYRFWERDADGNWSGLGSGDEYRPRVLPKSLGIVAVTWEGQAVAAGQRQVFAAMPAVFEIVLASGSERHRIVGGPSGRVRVEAEMTQPIAANR